MSLSPIQERNARLYVQAFPEVQRLRISRARNVDGRPHLTKRFTAEFEIDGKARRVNFGQVGAKTYSDVPKAGREMPDFDMEMFKKRMSYMARASKITNSSGEYTYKIPGTANSFAFWILWQ